MILISFIVPCYNSEEYMEKCIDSLMHFPEHTEIIIVDDGSTDSTPAICDRYVLNYPDTVKVIHQENRGHGGAINAGLAVSKGLYTKIVDSDDWLNPSSLETVIDRLIAAEKDGGVDLLVTNYSYFRKAVGERNGGGIEKTITYKSFFKPDVIETWDDVSVWKIRPWNQFLMHALTFRTEIVKKSGMTLPEKVYYEDNYIICSLFSHCKTILYLDLDFYVYLVGRTGQSVSRDVLKIRNNDVRMVTEMCWNLIDLDMIRGENKKLYHIMKHELWLLLSSAILFSRIPRTREADIEVKEFCRRLKNHNKKYYYRFMIGNLFILLRIPGPIGRFVSLDIVLNIAHAFVGFN